MVTGLSFVLYVLYVLAVGRGLMDEAIALRPLVVPADRGQGCGQAPGDLCKPLTGAACQAVLKK